ncbi:GAF domain-containing protein [Actinomadura flavalba]|uniref:GAF domain-containing protein n=1 Tax=Actinomadura flavalba TaxID=1120938 RepID=UPI00036AE6C9|nr:GAF domain-containing protein [Actinomadura flavalba]
MDSGTNADRRPPPHVCAEPRDLLTLLADAHDRQDALRATIAASWRRSGAHGVDVDVPSAPEALDADRLAESRAAHPLEPLLPMVRDLLRGGAADADQYMVVTDAAGHALWAEGPRRIRAVADRVGLAAGFCWSEASIGTNGIGTALATGRPEYVYAAEHRVRALHRWSCASAPVTDADTGDVIGCLDISDTVDRLHPSTVRLVRAVARLAETALESRMRRRDERLRETYGRHLRELRGEDGLLVTATGRVLVAEPDRWRGHRLAVPVSGAHVLLPDGRHAVAEPVGEVYLLRPTGRGEHRPLLALGLLGDEQPWARLGGVRVPLSLRHAEILALLALHPRGLTGERLARYLYGDDGSSTTVRAEIHRLRARFGPIIGAKPYRLHGDVDADFLAVRRLLGDGDVAGAARLWTGELLPASESPVLRAERDDLTVRLRDRLLRHPDPEPLWTYTRTLPGATDAEALRRLSALLPPSDPRRPAKSAGSEVRGRV